MNTRLVLLFVAATIFLGSAPVQATTWTGYLTVTGSGQLFLPVINTVQ